MVDVKLMYHNYNFTTDWFERESVNSFLKFPAVIEFCRRLLNRLGIFSHVISNSLLIQIGTMAKRIDDRLPVGFRTVLA